jgi:cytochrome P450
MSTSATTTGRPPCSLRDAVRAGAAVRGPRSIPALRGLSVLGSVLTFRNDRLGLMSRLGALGPIARYQMGPVPVHVITDAALAGELLVDHAGDFVKSAGLSIFLRPVLGNGLLTAEGDHHRRQRKLLAPAFAARRIAAYGEVMVAETERAIASWKLGAAPVALDAAEAMMEMTLAIAGRTLFSADVGGDARLIGAALVDAMQAMVDGLTSPVQVPYSWPLPRHRRMRRAVAALDSVVYRLVRERRAAGDDVGDVLSMLLLSRDDDGTGMTDAQVRDEVMTLLLAGHETTANALTWTLHALGRHPDIRARVEAEVDALGRAPTVDDVPRLTTTLMVIEEAMRLWPPAYAIGRQAVRDVTVGGYHFPAGAVVIVNIYGLHRRPDLYPEPDAFLPDRFAPELKKSRPRGAYLPFGGGARVCIGNHFALLEAQLALATLVRTVRLDPVSLAEPAGEPLVTLRPRGGLPMRAVLRRPPPAATAS